MDKIKAYEEAINDNECVVHANNLSRTFVGWNSNFSVSSAYNTEDYEFFRKNEKVPKERYEILRVCQDAYDKIGIIKTVIDIMSDFACKGITIEHPIPAVQRFYNKWFEKVNGVERTERFLNILYRLGTVIPYRTMGQITSSDEREYKKVTAAKNIPIKYTFINPAYVEVYNERFTTFVSDPIYILNFTSAISEDLHRAALNPKNDEIKKMYDHLPQDIKDAILRKENYILMDKNAFNVYFYKKDDWQFWPKPIIYSIIDDLIMYEKLRLADASALDGVISNVRLWNMGIMGDTPQKSLLPNKQMMQKLRNILAQNVSGGRMDLVWGPELSFKETSTNTHEFLGSAKYDPTMDGIYDGLGVPSSARSGKSGNTNSNYFSLKILIERLNYGRNVVTDFWNKEIQMIQKAMGFSKPGILSFENIVLSDESAEKQLWIHLADRNLVTNEAIQKRFGLNPSIQKVRIRKEEKNRVSKKDPRKASPYHNPTIDEKYIEILLQKGVITPKEAGLNIESKNGDKLALELEKKYAPKQAAKPNGMAGRPKNVTETTKRKKKAVKPAKVKGIAEIAVWASNTLDIISEVVNPCMLKFYEKKNLRQLSNKEAEQVDSLKANILFNLEPFINITSDLVYKNIENFEENKELNQKYKASIQELSQNKSLTVEDKRNIQISLYIEKWQQSH